MSLIHALVQSIMFESRFLTHQEKTSVLASTCGMRKARGFYWKAGKTSEEQLKWNLKVSLSVSVSNSVTLPKVRRVHNSCESRKKFKGICWLGIWVKMWTFEASCFTSYIGHYLRITCFFDFPPSRTMTVLNSCCIWHSVRKGSYVSGIYTLVRVGSIPGSWNIDLKTTSV